MISRPLRTSSKIRPTGPRRRPPSEWWRGDNLLNAVGELPPRLKLLLVLRFGLLDDRPRTLEEVGHELGVTRERVRQLEGQALELLRRSGSLPLLEEVDRSG